MSVTTAAHYGLTEDRSEPGAVLYGLVVFGTGTPQVRRVCHGRLFPSETEAEQARIQLPNDLGEEVDTRPFFLYPAQQQDLSRLAPNQLLDTLCGMDIRQSSYRWLLDYLRRKADESLQRPVWIRKPTPREDAPIWYRRFCAELHHLHTEAYVAPAHMLRLLEHLCQELKLD